MEQYLLRLDGLLLSLLFLWLLLWLQRAVHREIQSVFLLITRRADISYVIFSIIFLPGVLLHELSHFVIARLVGVRTGKFSILSRPLENGRLQLGYVETSSTDIIRDALIGSAPLITGGLFVVYVGIYQLNLNAFWDSLLSGSINVIIGGFSRLISGPDFWVWFYLTFTVSSTMLPSESDRRAWGPVAFIALVLLGLMILAGSGRWFLDNIVPVLNQAMRTTAIILGISTTIHLIILPPIVGLREGLSRLLGLRVL